MFVLKENLRLQVEEELEMARSKINTITKRIESRKRCLCWPVCPAEVR